MISVPEPAPATTRLFATKVGGPRIAEVNRGVGVGNRIDQTRGVDLLHSFGVGLTTKPTETRQTEKPWMRHAAHYLATGKYTMRQVAALCGVTYEALRAVSRNAWFNETVNALIAEHGGDDLLERWRAEWEASLVTAVEIRDEPKNGASVRLAAAKEIMDRVKGKAVQFVVTDNTVRSGDPVEEVALLERQLAERANRLGVSLPAIEAEFVEEDPAREACPNASELPGVGFADALVGEACGPAAPVAQPLFDLL